VEDSEVTTGQQISAKNVLAALPNLPVIEKIAERLGAKSEGQRAAALELALEALYLAKKIDKNTDDGETVYG
jgi:magnesium chelatase subunit I